MKLLRRPKRAPVERDKDLENITKRLDKLEPRVTRLEQQISLYRREQ